MKFETKVIHVGQEPEKAAGSIIPPIYPSSVYTIDDIGQEKSYMYSRYANPTRDILEECLAAAENAKYCMTFASGVSAASAVLSLLKPDDHIVATRDLYGGTYKLFEEIYSKQNITASYVCGNDCCNFEDAINENTKLIWIESPTNPLLKLIDIKKTAELCRERGILLCVDNTFATPYLQNPLELGADIIIHSTTKYINGHSDVVGGAVLTNDDELYEKINQYQIVVGAVPSAFDSWLILRGLKTLNLRMERHCRNAQRVAEFLANNSEVEQVFYPGLKSNPYYNVALSQMRDFGGMVSFKIKGGKQQVDDFISALKLIKRTVSLGGIESLICSPFSTTHASLPLEMKNELGITENLVRISIGVEHIDDILEDIETAFSYMKKMQLTRS